MNHSEITSFIWGVADLIRDTFNRGKYQDVILPLTVLRRLDCVLAPTKADVLKADAKYRGRIEDPSGQLRRASGFAFYNTSSYDFEKLLGDAPNLAPNLRNYVAGFSKNMCEVLDKFNFDNTITKLDDAGLLFQVMQRFNDPKINLHPDVVDNFTMGTIFEELIRKFNEARNENPGEHFTPRDVVHLMVDLLLAGDEELLGRDGVVLTIYDPCCGSGGMLTIAKEHINIGERREDQLLGPAINPKADVHLFGQEVNPETFAICKSDLFMKSVDGRDAENILLGSTLSNDRHTRNFDYMIANPPYGKDWKGDQEAVKAEHDQGYSGRFGQGLPKISDGQLLFLLHMLAHSKKPSDGGSRIAIIMNGSPLFTGKAESGESEIRRWILENDWLEALIALPEQLFYNTGIATYVWVLTNRKDSERQGKVQLINATSFWSPLRKNLGAKRRAIPSKRKQDIVQLLSDFEDGAVRCVVEDGKEREVVVSRIYPTTHFGFRKITVERPLRLDFRASPDRIARLEEERAFKNLAVSRKKGAARAEAEAKGRMMQTAIRAMLLEMPDELFLDRTVFEEELMNAVRSAEIKLTAPIKKAILAALSERNDEAMVCRDRKRHPEPDPVLRDTESVPLSETIEAFFDCQVRPHVPDAWIDTKRKDRKDGEIGIVGYKINFNKYFYEYRPPRALEEIEADIRHVQEEIMAMLHEVAS